jgi:hypothetical protein
MKKILSISLLAGFLTFGIGASAASAKPVNSIISASSVAQRWGWQRPRSRFITRTERQGFHLYRVTYRVTNFRGRTQTTMVSRVRIR